MWNAEKENLDLTQNIAHPSWETIDPTPNIRQLFEKFNSKFFQGRLAAVELEWSKRMYQCAGICYSRRNKLGMSCVIRLSEPLLKLRSRKELVDTLIHEMIHAYLFVLNIREGNGGHGPNFLKIAHEINSQAGTNITVYHTFHDEVNFYKKHHWRCNGPCKNRAPYFGYVKRVANRAPGPNDFWFGEHLRSCGGTFQKVQEPSPAKPKQKVTRISVKITKKAVQVQSNQITNYVKGGVMNKGSGTLVIRPSTSATRKTESKSLKTPTTSPQRTPAVFSVPAGGNLANVRGFGRTNSTPRSIPKPSSSNGNILGGNSEKRSRLLDMFEKPKAKHPRIEPEEPEKPMSSEERQNQVKAELLESHPDDEIVFLDDEFNDSDFDYSTMTAVTQPIIDLKFKEEPEDDNRTCVLCSQSVPRAAFQVHVDDCASKICDIFNESDEQEKRDADEFAEQEIRDADESNKQENRDAEESDEQDCQLIEPVVDTIDVENLPEPPRLAEPETFVCPNCPKSFSLTEINAHLDVCLSE